MTCGGETLRSLHGLPGRQVEAQVGCGADMEAIKKRSEERLRLAKERSSCSACKRRGCWHRNPKCPLGRQQGEVMCFMTGANGEPCHKEEKLFADQKHGGLPVVRAVLQDHR